jgi:two-component sensor histidine kinase
MMYFSSDVDYGVGIPEQVSFENSKGFMMQIIIMLVGQMCDTIRIERISGKRFVLEFGC